LIDIKKMQNNDNNNDHQVVDKNDHQVVDKNEIENKEDIQ